MQAKASQISAIIGGKMPHVMTLVPGGTAFVPTDQKLDDLKSLVDEIYDWVEATMIPDTLAIAPYYIDALNWGKGCGRYVAWGVFESESMELKRPLPAHGRHRRQAQPLRREGRAHHRVHGPLLVQGR